MTRCTPSSTSFERPVDAEHVRIRYLELAKTDLIAAWSWYEDQQPGLGDQLLAAVDASLDQIVKWPRSGTPTGNPSERRVAVRGFPYAIRYRVTGDELLITAILHQHRRPDFGTDRND